MADVTKVVAGRNSKVFLAPWGASNALPADTVVWGTTWGGTFVEQGYTDGGVTFGLSIDRADITVDQELDPILRPITGRGVTLSGNFSEFSPAKIKDGIGQGAVTTLAAISGTRGHDDYNLTSTVTDQYVSAGFDILNPGDNEAIRVVGWRCLATGGVDTTFGVADAAAQVPYEYSALPDSSTSPSRILTIRDIIAALP